jgi:hypothetical protein
MLKKSPAGSLRKSSAIARAKKSLQRVGEPADLPKSATEREAHVTDVISAGEFCHSGDYFATGDRGGRVVIFKRQVSISVCVCVSLCVCVCVCVCV